MAMIKCPECGREISDKAESCPGCGHEFDTSSKSSKENRVFILIMIIFALLFVSLFIYSKISTKKSAENSVVTALENSGFEKEIAGITETAKKQIGEIAYGESQSEEVKPVDKFEFEYGENQITVVLTEDVNAEQSISVLGLYDNSTDLSLDLYVLLLRFQTINIDYSIAMQDEESPYLVYCKDGKLNAMSLPDELETVTTEYEEEHVDFSKKLTEFLERNDLAIEARED